MSHPAHNLTKKVPLTMTQPLHFDAHFNELFFRDFCFSAVSKQEKQLRPDALPAAGVIYIFICVRCDKASRHLKPD